MTNDQCSCANDCEVTCIVHPTPRSMKERIAELEAELTKARDNVVGTRRIFHQYLRKTKEVRLLCLELEVENRRLLKAIQEAWVIPADGCLRRYRKRG